METDPVLKDVTQTATRKETNTMYRTINNLHEYRLRYPDTASIPTLTQSGLLGLLLALQDRKAAALERRSAKWKRIWATPGNACAGIWRALNMTELNRPIDPAQLVTRPQI